MFARTFKIAGRGSSVESHFGKVTKNVIPAYNSVENSVTCIGVFQKVALLETSRNSLLTRISGLKPTGCNAAKNELLTRFLKDVCGNKMTIPENLQEEFCNRVSFQ